MFGDKLKKAREARGLTQEALGELMGISRQQVNRWEKGNKEPNAKTLREMAQHLGVSADYLLGLADTFNGHVETQNISPDEWRVLRALRSGMIREAIESTIDISERIS